MKNGPFLLSGLLAALAMPCGCDDGNGRITGDGDADADSETGDSDVATDGNPDAQDGNDAVDTPPDTPDITTDDAWTDADVPASCEKTTELALSLLAGGGLYGKSVLDESQDIVIVIPDYLGPSTRRLTAVSLAAGEEAALSLEASGDLPPLWVTGAAYDPAAGRSVILAYAMQRPGDGGIGDHMELVSIALDGAGGAAMTRLEPSAAPPSEGIMFSAIYPEGDGVHYRAFRFSTASVRATVSGATVSWEPEVTLTSDGLVDMNIIAHDPTGNRLLSYGESVIEGTPEDYTMFVDPTVFALSLAGGTSWTRLPAMGSPPARQESMFGIIPAAAYYDDTGRRLIVTQDHPFTDPWMGEMMVTGVWAFSDDGSWTAINENLGYCCTNSGWHGMDDRARRRSIMLAGPGFTGVDLAPGREGQPVSIDLGAALWPDGISAAFDTTLGRIVAGSSTGLLAMAVREGDFVWRAADGGAAWPTASSTGYSLSYDEGSARILLFGGSDPTTFAPTAQVSAIDPADPSGGWLTAVTAGDAPAARSWHSAVVDPASHTLLVVAGYALEGSTVTDLADVAALDLSSMTWRAVATLPVARSAPLLRVSGDDLFVLLGESHANPSDPYAVTLLSDAYRVSISTGAVEPLAVTGDLPTVSSRAMAGLDLPSGYIIVSPEPYGVDVFLAAFSAGSVSLTRTSSCEDPRALGYGPGVVDPATGLGYVVGQSLWEITP